MGDAHLGHRRGAGWVAAILALEIVVFAVTTVPGVRDAPGFVGPVDGVLQAAAYVTAAVLALLRPLTDREDRVLWSLVAAAMACRAAAFVVYLAVIRTLDPQPYPSAADVGWLAMALLLLVAVGGLLRGRLGRLSTALVLDALIATAAATAVALVLLEGTIEGATAAGIPEAAIATNLAYPLLDVALIVVVLGALTAYGWQPPRAVWLLAAGTIGFAVTDAVYLHLVIAGGFRPGTPLGALSLVATALIAGAGWVPDGARRTTRQMPAVVVPTLLALACLTVLVVAAIRDVPLAAVVLGAAGLAIAIARTVLSFRDVRAVAEARRDARVDDLTGAVNRRGFNELLDRLIARRAGQPLALLVVDLDKFKDVNDALGHHHGDELLRHVADRLRLGLRSDDVLARVGGDEFVVVVPGADARVAVEVTERLQSALKRPFVLAGQQMPVEASVGVAVLPDDADDGEALLRAADLAMYDAKSSGSAYRLYQRERHRGVQERLSMLEELRRAITGGELVLHFQPQVALRSGAVVGVEALVRWQHPEHGLLPPGRFLPQAESGGLMRPLSLEVLGQSIRQSARWRAQGRDVVVSVYLSVSNLLDPDLPEQAADLLREHGVRGDRLVVELTEDVFLADPARGGRVIRGLLDLGIRMAVDDYGTGFSSLAYLRELREISQLKLDRSFVQGVAGDRRAQAIVGSTIGLAEALDLELVAEGVETDRERALLTDLGCQIAQGFLFSRPLPADEVELEAVSS